MKRRLPTNGVRIPLRYLLSLSRLFACFAGLSLFGAEQAGEIADPSFRNHIQPVLTKAGCNMGACHGAAAGKNGFYLSLRGYNDEADWLAITRNTGGRRIDTADPGRSLLLLKATGAVPHKGGKRFEAGSPEYSTLANWIAAGATGPKESDARLERLEVQPAHSTLKHSSTNQLTVLAHFTDGRTENVTRWAKFTSAQETVANVNDTGEVRVIGSGEGAISAWYLSQLAVANLTVPYTNTVSQDAFAKLSARNFIDEQVNAKLRELNLPPSARASDAEFIRRASLDTIGVLPTAEEVKEFLRGSSDDEAKSRARRDALVERLLNRPEFTDYWAYKWSDLLLVNSRTLPPKAARAYYAWIRDRVDRNTPWDVFAQEIVTATGSSLENGAANFYVLHDDPRTMAETVTQAFMGMSVGCARCHNHPSEKWTNDDYFAFANLFSRLKTKNGAADGAERILSPAPSGELTQPRTGKPQQPRPLAGKKVDFNDATDRRAHVANWLTSPENPYFAKAVVNRVWANFFGVGLVDRVDDLRVSNPASNEALFQATASFLVREKYDLKALMREILRSETYQRSSETIPANAADTRFYARYYPRRLMAEVILDAYAQVTGVPTDFSRDTGNGDTFAMSYPRGTRALQLPDSQIASYFLKSFGKPDRIQTCECERTGEPSVAQVLHIANGSTLNDKLRSEQCAATKKTMSDAATLDDAYLRALSRFPTDTEKQKLLPVLSKTSDTDKRAALEDLYWALMSSKEFLFNH